MSFVVLGKSYLTIEDVVNKIYRKKGGTKTLPVQIVSKEVSFNVNFLSALDISSDNSKINITKHLRIKSVSFKNCDFSILNSNITIVSGCYVTFENCTFTSVGKGKLEIEGHSFVSITNCTFNNFPIDIGNANRINLTSSKFIGNELETECLVKSQSNILTVVKCQFVKANMGLQAEKIDIPVAKKDNKLVKKLVHEFKIEDCSFESCSSGFSSKSMITTASRCSFQKFSENACSLDNCQASISDFTMKGSGKFGIKVDNCVEKIDINDCKIENCQTGLSIDSSDSEKNTIQGCIFLGNEISLFLNAKLSIIYCCSFISSKSSSILCKSPQSCALQYTNFLEKDDEVLRETFGFKDSGRFAGLSPINVALWTKSLTDRLNQAYLLHNFRKNKDTEVKLLLRSVKLVFVLLKKTKAKSMVLESLKKRPRVGLFISFYKVKKYTLLDFEEVFKSWLSLNLPKVYDSAIEALHEKQKSEKIFKPKELQSRLKTLEVTKLEKLRGLRDQKKLPYLLFLVDTQPLFVLKELETLHPNSQIQVLLKFAEDSESWYSLEALRRLAVDHKFHKENKYKDLSPRDKFIWTKCCFEGKSTDDILLQVPQTEYLKLKLGPYPSKRTANIEHRAQLSKFMASVLVSDGPLNVSFRLGLNNIKTYEQMLEFSAGVRTHLTPQQQPINYYNPQQQQQGLTLHTKKRIKDINLKALEYWADESKRSPLKLFSSTLCVLCEEVFKVTELTTVHACSDLSHVFCLTCFQEYFSKLKTTCPTKGCKAKVTRRDLEMGEVSQSRRELIITHKIRRKVDKLTKDWYRCTNDGCFGGSKKLIKGLYFSCKLCSCIELFGKGVKADDVLDELDISVEVAILILRSYKACVGGCRFPEFYIPFGFLPELFATLGKYDIPKLRTFISTMSMTEETFMASTSALQAEFLKWSINTNPFRVRKIPAMPKVIDNDGLMYPGGPNVIPGGLPPGYVLPGQAGIMNDISWFQIQSPQEQEVEFQKLKARYGSYFSFHGSPFYNWYSICRSGIRLMSNSKYRLHGGVGIYCARDLNIPFGYSQVNINSVQDAAFAVIEVIKTGHQFPPNLVIRVPQKEEHVQIRFIGFIKRAQ